MFRALYAHHQQDELYYAASGIVTLSKWSSVAQVEREMQFPLNLCIGRPLTESNDTRCWISTIQPPDDEHICSKHGEDYNKRIVK